MVRGGGSGRGAILYEASPSDCLPLPPYSLLAISKNRLSSSSVVKTFGDSREWSSCCVLNARKTNPWLRYISSNRSVLCYVDEV